MSSSRFSFSISPSQPPVAASPKSFEEERENSVFDQCVKIIKSGENSFLFRKYFEERKISVDKQDTKGWTLLHYAMKYSKYSTAKYLIDKGANINA